MKRKNRVVPKVFWTKKNDQPPTAAAFPVVCPVFVFLLQFDCRGKTEDSTVIGVYVEYGPTLKIKTPDAFGFNVNLLYN